MTGNVGLSKQKREILQKQNLCKSGSTQLYKEPSGADFIEFGPLLKALKSVETSVSIYRSLLQASPAVFKRPSLFWDFTDCRLLVSDEPGQSIGPIFRGQSGTDRLFWNVDNKLSIGPIFKGQNETDRMSRNVDNNLSVPTSESKMGPLSCPETSVTNCPSVPSSRVKMGPIGCPETSITTYRS